jgi:hypothetical protein
MVFCCDVCWSEGVLPPRQCWAVLGRCEGVHE